MKKTHISVNVSNLERAIDFYRDFLQVEPANVRPGYANFDLDSPPVKLALNESSGATGLSHLGVQVDGGEAVQAAIARFQAGGRDSLTEMTTDCCHALAGQGLGQRFGW